MKRTNLSLLAGFLMIGILATSPNRITNIPIEHAEILDDSLIAITAIHDANIHGHQIEIEIEITDITA